jgi:hypothetical protein
MRVTFVLILCCLLVAGGASLSEAAEQHMMQPLVPADKLAAARAHEPVAEVPGDRRAGQSAR